MWVFLLILALLGGAFVWAKLKPAAPCGCKDKS